MVFWYPLNTLAALGSQLRLPIGSPELFFCVILVFFGDVWKNKIDDALEKTDIALLFISANFIASDFIFEHELKVLLKKHRNQNIVILLLRLLLN